MFQCRTAQRGRSYGMEHRFNLNICIRFIISHAAPAVLSSVVWQIGKLSNMRARLDEHVSGFESQAPQIDADAEIKIMD